jgi:hypothetical protein
MASSNVEVVACTSVGSAVAVFLISVVSSPGSMLSRASDVAVIPTDADGFQCFWSPVVDGFPAIAGLPAVVGSLQCCWRLCC